MPYFYPVDVLFGREHSGCDRGLTKTMQVNAFVATISTNVWRIFLGRPAENAYDGQGPVWPGGRIAALEGYFTSNGVPYGGADQADAGWWSATRTPQGTGQWAITGGLLYYWHKTVASPAAAAAAPTEFSNGTTPCFSDFDRTAILEAAAGTFAEGLSPGVDGFRGVVTWELTSAATVGLFGATLAGTDRPPIMTAALAQALARINQNGDALANLGFQSDGVTPNIVNGVRWAFPRGDNNYYITAADLGAGAWQIPDIAAGGPANNTIAKFEQHPSVFIRRGTMVRGFDSEYRDNYGTGTITSNVGTPGQLGDSGVRLRRVDRAPTHSRWLLRIDGSLVDATIAHPAGSDFRRPRDIWNRVIVPAIGPNTRNTNPINLYDFRWDTVGGARTFDVVSQIHSLRYLESATFVDVYDGAADITTTVEQFAG